jgi:hypothetical protein
MNIVHLFDNTTHYFNVKVQNKHKVININNKNKFNQKKKPYQCQYCKLKYNLYCKLVICSLLLEVQVSSPIAEQHVR